MTNEHVVDLFTYHPPQDAVQIAKYQEVRGKCKELALWIKDNTVESAEQTLVIRRLHEASMLTNACIALHEKD